MTKLKNTKKGMAKKALSISLVAAMLATSNVPVWAAEFTDGTDAVVEAPVVEEFAAEAPVEEETVASTLAVAESYTVNTNMELKRHDWNTNLELAVKEGITNPAKFEILDGNSLPVQATKVEVYGGLGMIQSANVSGGNVASALASVKVGKESFLESNQVTAKVYVGETVVCELSAAVDAVDISEFNISLDKDQTDYTGEIQTPVATVTESGLTADVVVRFVDATEAKDAGTYSCYAEGIGAFTGITTKKATYKINPATATNKNLSVVLSGDITYNGVKSLPEVEVRDIKTGEVLPKELYTVEVTNTKVGSYTNSNIKNLTLKAIAKVGEKTITNNFAAGSFSKSYITGTYKVSALNLSNLSDKYDITTNARENANITWNDLIIVDKSTGKTVKAKDVWPTEELSLKSVLNNETKVATATITPGATAGNNITGSYSFDYSVVANVIGKEDISFPKGTKIGTTTLSSKKALNDATVSDAIDRVLGNVYYTGSAIEPLKDVFSNMVLTTTVGTSDQQLVLGQDYDLVYEENTESKAVSNKESSIKLVFKGQYTGTIKYPFTIQKAQVTVKALPANYVSGQNAYDLVVEVMDSKSKTAVPTKDYTVTTTKKGTKIGTYAEGNVVFTNKNYNITSSGASTNDAGFMYVSGLKSKVTAKTLANCTGSVEGEYVYTGETVNPKVVVKDGDVVLTENKDYKVVSKVGVNAGPAYVIVEGMGNYSGRLTINYTIKKANLANAIVESKNKDKKNYDVPYTGALVGPSIARVLIGKDTLIEYDAINNKGDYILTFDENAVDVGTYSFTITAAPSSKKVEGEFKGTYKVVPSKMTGYFATQIGLNKVNVKNPLAVKDTGAVYTGGEIKIDSFKTKYVVIDSKNNVLTEGKDYRLEYSNNTNAGLATVKAYGLGNHAYVDANGVEIPMATMNFYIGGKTIESSMVKKINNAEYAGGLVATPEVVVMFDKDTRLVQGKDYIVTTTVSNIGKYTERNITIIGTGAYTTVDAKNTKMTFATSNLNWEVVKKDIKNTDITVTGKNVTVMNGTVVVPSTEYDVKFSEDGKKATVTAKADSKYYTGSKEVSTTGDEVAKAEIKDVKVVGNKATVILDGEVDGATGYDFVISTNGQSSDADRLVNKNVLVTDTTFQYLQKGTYWAHCHAWKKVDGKKEFGAYSEPFAFSVYTTTPEQPSVTNVKVSKNTVTVTYTKCKDATGYDIVLGSAKKKVNGEMRPVKYGKLVKKVTNGEKVTAIFTKVPKGTYYVGLHAYNRSSVDNKKVFSPWSASKTIKVK